MQVSSTKLFAYQVLIASGSETFARLLQPLQQIVCPTESLAESGGLIKPRQRVVFNLLDFDVVDLVMRSKTSDCPFAVAILDVQPGAEVRAEQILNALYYAEPDLHLIVVLEEGSALSQPISELITQSPRMVFIQQPTTLAQVYQFLKLMLAQWQTNRRLELQLEQRRKQGLDAGEAGAGSAVPGSPSMHLEMMGSLASGIAHEFNNVLTVIQNQMDMALQQAGKQPEMTALLSQVKETASNAAALSGKLVSIAPEDIPIPAALDVQASLDEETALLGKTLGEHISLETYAEPRLPNIWMPASTFSQAIINVALHARSMMTEGGVLQFTATAADLQTGSKHARLFPDMPHGEYVLLTVEDPNPAEAADTPGKVVVTLSPTAQRVADDRLAWIQKSMQDFGGAFTATLLPGMIRSYQLLFPLARNQTSHSQEQEDLTVQTPAADSAASGESVAAQPATVLVVDDDDTICMIMRQVLATEKHRVLVAKNADEAWQQWCQHRSSIKLLITDINMPGGANGVTLGHAIQEQDGSVPVIYTSGHRAVHQYAELEVGTNYLPKPFGMNDLLQVTNRALATHLYHGLT